MLAVMVSFCSGKWTEPNKPVRVGLCLRKIDRKKQCTQNNFSDRRSIHFVAYFLTSTSA